MNKITEAKVKIKYILENIYLEVLFIYIVLIFNIIVPVLRLIIVTIERSSLRYFFIGILERMNLKHVVRNLFLVETMAMLSLIFILIIILIIAVIRLRKKIFFEKLLLYNLFRKYNSDFKVYAGATIPITLAAVYCINYLLNYNFVQQSTTTLIIILIITISLLNYIDQLNSIIHSISNIGNKNNINISFGCFSLFTIKTIRMIDDIDKEVQVSIDKQLKSERLKTELITNISHDLKTPLTSIINYTDLLKNSYIENNTILSYADALDRNSQRLKTLITDLVESSKTETGNVNINIEKLEINELISQVYGEFDTIFKEKNISVIFNLQDDVFVLADGNHLGRVLENIISNASKYTLENTRIYGEVKEQEDFVSFVLKNISKEELNISPDELMEQFIRGERSRHTEGSGLGLYIAKNIMKLMNGELLLEIDGDLFQVKILIPKVNK